VTVALLVVWVGLRAAQRVANSVGGEEMAEVARVVARVVRVVARVGVGVLRAQFVTRGSVALLP